MDEEGEEIEVVEVARNSIYLKGRICDEFGIKDGDRFLVLKTSNGRMVMKKIITKPKTLGSS